MAQNKVIICGIDTSKLPKLTDTQSEDLLKKIKEGDARAREDFIIGNMRLVLSIVRRFSSCKKVSADDLFQAGCIGLIKAIENFNINLGVKFSTYGVPMIVGELRRYIRTANSLRVSRSIRDTAYQVLKTRAEIEADKDTYTIKEIAERLNIAEREVVYALDAISDPVSLYDPVYNKEGDTLMLLDQIGDERNTDELWTENVALECAINTLEDREKKILYMRYYEGKTQTEVSDEIRLSQAQVSRLEKSALKTIKSIMQ